MDDPSDVPRDDRPATATADRGALEAQVTEVIELIRPALQMDGGDISLVAIDDDLNVQVALAGACVGCPASVATLKAGVERIIKDRVPEVNEVLSV